jgi:SAM-dependent methyltransferase
MAAPIARMFTGLINDVAAKAADVPSAAVADDFVINPAKTQRANTLPTYQKALDVLGVGEGDEVLDYGAGLGLGADAASLRGAKVSTFEPFPQGEFKPTYTVPDDVPEASADKILNMNVLNVLPREERDKAVLTIGKALRPGGSAVINVRPAGDVKAAKTAVKADDEGGFIVGSGKEKTYQKGFTQKELKKYIEETLGPGFIVDDVKGLTGPTIRITKVKMPDVAEYAELAANPFPSTVESSL